MLEQQNEEVLHSAPKSGQTDFHFAALGQGPAAEERDYLMQARRDIPPIVKRSAAMLKMTASIMNALVVHPGGEADAATLDAAAREIMNKALLLTQASTELVGLDAAQPSWKAYNHIMRQQAVDLAAAQWRLAHASAAKEFSVERIQTLFGTVSSALAEITTDAELEFTDDPDLDLTTAMRIALLGVAPEIQDAVICFDYLNPEPDSLVEKGVREVVAAAAEGVRRIVPEAMREREMPGLARSMIEKAGALYATNYKVIARRDVQKLMGMEPVERQRHVYVHREAGLPTQHVDEAFRRLMTRMIDLVVETVPELNERPPVAPGGATRATPHPTLTKERLNDSQPE